MCNMCRVYTFGLLPSYFSVNFNKDLIAPIPCPYQAVSLKFHFLTMPLEKRWLRQSIQRILVLPVDFTSGSEKTNKQVFSIFHVKNL